MQTVVENKAVEVKEIIPATEKKAPLLVNVNKEKAKAEKAKAPAKKKENAPKENKALSVMNAIGLTEKVKQASAQRSVFKKEFNNKSDRTKCRTKFFNALEQTIIFLAHDKKDLAKEQFLKAKEVANKYYVAESSFKVYSDYCTENNEKKGSVKAFIELINDKAYKYLHADK